MTKTTLCITQQATLLGASVFWLISTIWYRSSENDLTQLSSGPQVPTEYSLSHNVLLGALSTGQRFLASWFSTEWGH